MDGLAILEAFCLLRQTFPSPLQFELVSIRDAAEAITETGPARFALRLQLGDEALQERRAFQAHVRLRDEPIERIQARDPVGPAIYPETALFPLKLRDAEASLEIEGDQIHLVRS